MAAASFGGVKLATHMKESLKMICEKVGVSSSGSTRVDTLDSG